LVFDDDEIPGQVFEDANQTLFNPSDLPNPLEYLEYSKSIVGERLNISALVRI
jgi:hypothetical protein